MRGLKAILKNSVVVNSLWLFLDRGYGALITLYVYSLLATYFGVDLFGVWNYLLAFTAILPAISSLGLNFVIVKNIKERPILSNLILGNTMMTRSLAGIIIGVLLWIVYYFLGVNIESKFIAILVLLFISQVLLNANVFIFQNEANLENNKTVLFRNIALTISSILRIAAIKFELDIVFFAVLNILEYGLFLFLSWTFSKQKLSKKDLLLNNKISVIFLKQGLPLMLSAVVVVIYLKVDQLIIAFLLDNESVGIYSAASRISELFYALPVIVSNVFFPKILEYKSNMNKRNILLDQMHFVIFIMTILVATLVYTFSEFIILTLFGHLYIESIGILEVYAWSLVFMGFLVGSSKFLLTIGRNDIILKRGLFGLISNIILNFIMIPAYGIIGAAYATLISYFIASYLSNLFFKDLRPLMIHQLVAVIKIPKMYITNQKDT